MCDDTDSSSIVESELPSSLLDQVRASVAEYSEVADDDLLQAVTAMEQTECDNELTDDALLSAVADVEKNIELTADETGHKHCVQYMYS